MTEENRRWLGLKLPLQIRSYTALAAAVAGFIVAADHVYSHIKASQFAHDAGELAHGARLLLTRSETFDISVGGETFATDPRDAAIRSAVLAAAARAQDRFVVLSNSGEGLIEAAVEKGGWNLEFRAGSIEHAGSAPLLFGCQKPVTREVVIEALQLYREGSDSWTTLCAWTRVLLMP